jgi:hypothetical protein
VQGVECCRLLLLGELPLDVEVLPNGARSASLTQTLKTATAET